MRWLVRLVTPPEVPTVRFDPENCSVCRTGGYHDPSEPSSECDCTGEEPLYQPRRGLVLDPFAGSGSTGCAAVLEGFDFIGIEREPEYVALAEGRLRFWSQFPVGTSVDEALASEAKVRAQRDAGQMELTWDG
jgi:hypothetical protein